ncbi:Maintenance of telomere capping protein 4 [Meyerozyma sp. JA9]|nr:Maintenance of telomere capping protein 4 [Meyerozyma sp. JA9]
MSPSQAAQATTPVSPRSPLIPLRLSSGEAKNDHGEQETKRNKPKDSHKGKKSYKRSAQPDLPPNKFAVSNDWFNFDVPKSTRKTRPEDKSPQEAQVQRAAQLASLLLDTRKVVQSNDVVQPPNEDRKSTSIAASSSTLARADKVRTMLGLKYLYIQRVYEWSQSPESIAHPGVEGVYNPLQIIRNRKIRAKYKEYPRQLTIRLLPLPCNAFSSHNDSRKNWRMLWGIDLNELLDDTFWRQDHWHEIKTPKGQLWFPNRNHSNESSLETPSHGRKIRRRMHEKLFADDVSDSSKEIKSSSLNTSITDEDDGKFLIRISRAKSPNRRRDHVKRRVKRGARKLYLGSSPSTSESESDVDDLEVEPKVPTGPTGPHEDLSKQFFKPVSPASNDDDVDPLDSSPKRMMVPPEIYVESENEVKKVPFKSMSRVHVNTDDSTPDSDNVQETTSLSVEQLQACDNDICVTRSQFSYLQAVIELKLYYMTNLYPELVNKLTSIIEEIVEVDLAKLNESTFEIHESILPTYEMLYNGFNDEIKSVIHQINENYSVRIDNLLSSSDRSIGEVNTSISHELRKVNEKLDRLNNSFFGGMIAGALKDNEYMNMNDSGNKQILYLILENCIVISLRIIWVIANVFRGLLYIIRVIWRIIRIFI